MVYIAAWNPAGHCLVSRGRDSMRQLLTPVLALHWMMVFALLAGVLTLGGSGDVDAVFRLMGVVPAIDAPPAVLGGTAPLFFAVGFSLVAALFLWTALDGAFGAEHTAHGNRDVSLLAFAGAVVMLTAVLVYGVALPASGLMRANMASVAALLVSYLAIAVESWFSSARPTDDQPRNATVQAMAADAVHALRLSHIAGRIDASRTGGDA
jgi:hypothetical protein